MHDPKTFWLTLVNIALGLAVVLLVLGVVTGVVRDYVATFRKRRALWREIDKDMHNAFHK